jgi:hypothetical protein
MKSKYLEKLNRGLGMMIILTLLTTIFFSCAEKEKTPSASMVILIGIDGMSIPGFQMAETPNMDELVRNGALSFRTRGVMPTVSGPNWASHLLGAGPEQHGVTFNGWAPGNIILTPTTTDESGYFPSVFTVIREQRPGAITGFFYDWDVLIDIFNQDNITKVEYSDFYTETFSIAIPWIIENKPLLTFLYIGNPDEVGHKFKWESPEFVKSLEDVDIAIGELMNELKEAGLFQDVHFIVVSDHGGIDYGHGGVSMEEIKVPWIISGPGIIRNRMIEQSNDVFNTASTIAALLGLQQPWEWIGRPVKGAFEGSSMADANRRVYVPQPFSNIGGGIYDQNVEIDFSVVPAGPEIRYTRDGGNPDKNSPIWEGPQLLSESTVIRAAAFDGAHMSRISTVDFVKVIPVSSIRLTYPPAERYSSAGPSTLINRQMASDNFMDGKWLGFQTRDLDATLTLVETREVSSVRLGYLYNPNSWIFEPQNLIISGSQDGKEYFELGRLNLFDINEQKINGRNETGFTFPPKWLKYLKIHAENIGVCPPGHPGEGEPAWLFVDEILVK